MNRILTLRALVLGLIFGLAPLASSAQTAPGPVQALVYSTMPSTAAHRPEMALDGDSNTYFRSAYGMGDGDDFLVLLSGPISVQSMKIQTGDADGQDLLTQGFVETSADGVTYTRAVSFDSAGAATVTGPAAVRAFRIRVDPQHSVPALLVREITITSPAKIARVLLGPGRGFVDISQAPDLAAWAQKAETQMEESWDDTAALLYSDRFITPNMVNVVYRTGPGVTAVAATGGGVMTVNSKWCRANPEDTGLTVHETAHVIQAFSAYDPVWLVEGIADYIRWIRFEPENYHPQVNVKTATYHDAYRTTALFLAWCERHYDSRLVSKLNEDVRFGNYKNSLFKTYCGKDVDTLWSEFVTDYQADPTTSLFAPPVPAADRPRTLPTALAGSGVPIDLSKAFSAVGITRDGAVFGADSGVDSGGYAYSAAALGPKVTWKTVPFLLGPPDKANIVSGAAQTVALPAGQYAALWLLGTAVEGGRKAQTLTVTYTDGTTTTLDQNFSDWFQPQNFPGESRAVKTSYRNVADGSKDPRTFYVYSYGFALDSTKTVKSLTLPESSSVKLLAATLTK